jgi:thioredoxin reductase (NADPH)
LEEALFGGQAVNIAGLENYPGLYPPLEGAAFGAALEAQARAAGALVAAASVTGLRREGDGFVLKTSRPLSGEGIEAPLSGLRELTAPAVLLATGAKPRPLGVPGEEGLTGRGVSYCAVCDGPFFRGKSVAVVGGGNSACDEALFLSHIASTVTLIHRRDRFRADQAVIDRVLAAPNIRCRMNTVVEEITGGNKVEALVLRTHGGTPENFPVGGVFIFAGYLPQNALATDLAALSPEGYLLTDAHMATSVPGLYAAGDLRVSPLRQVVTAAADGAIAAHSVAAYLVSGNLHP